MRLVLYLLAGLVIVVVLVWLGLRIRPAPFPPFATSTGGQETATGRGTSGEQRMVALPDDLPEPVERFYLDLYGDQVPAVETAVVSGRASLRIAGVTMPGRFRFGYRAGEGYRHYIEATLFGLPVIRVDETYLDGEARLELPFGVTEGEPKVNQAANLGLWAEAIWFPTIYLTDGRVGWQAVDEDTAVLRVPFGEEEQTLVARFEAPTGRLRFFESLRYREADSATKSLWINEVREWGEVDGRLLPVGAALTWYEEGSPWAHFEIDEVVYGVDVDEFLRGGA